MQSLAVTGFSLRGGGEQKAGRKWVEEREGERSQPQRSSPQPVPSRSFQSPSDPLTKTAKVCLSAKILLISDVNRSIRQIHRAEETLSLNCSFL